MEMNRYLGQGLMVFLVGGSILPLDSSSSSCLQSLRCTIHFLVLLLPSLILITSFHNALYTQIYIYAHVQNGDCQYPCVTMPVLFMLTFGTLWQYTASCYDIICGFMLITYIRVINMVTRSDWLLALIAHNLW